MKQETILIGDRPITLEIGEIAKQASGAVIVKQRDTVLLVTAVANEKIAEGGDSDDGDFVPLMVEYREKSAAGGKIPSGFIKREGRPQDHEILACRLIDRSIRPLFTGSFPYDTQVIATVFSFDPDAEPEALCILGAAAALYLSDIPWNGPLAAVKLVQKNGKFILFPTLAEKQDATLELIISCAKNGLVMVEGLAKEVSENDVLAALQYAQDSLAPFFALMAQWSKELNVTKRPCIENATPESLEKRVTELFYPALKKALDEAVGKMDRKKKVKEMIAAIKEIVTKEQPEQVEKLPALISALQHKAFRQYMVNEQKRVDGRKFTEIRPISGRVGWLPRAHGSALFTRGETQAIVTCTLGTSQDEQTVDSLSGEKSERFFLHYNFPPYSVGEVKPLRGTGRREIGHGALATRALAAVLPSEIEFPYTVRIVSDITESNGSSSMASVCGGCLSLMDSGVPIKRPVAGVAMGLIQESGHILILSDIMGEEDHLGDMDFKVAGTEVGITAVQMDNKIGSLEPAVMIKALKQAREGRLHILGEMGKILPKTRPELSRYSPRILSLTIRKERIRDLIGPGGKNIQEIQTTNKVRIDVESETGFVKIYSSDQSSGKQALRQVENLTKDLEVGKIYRGVVTGVKDFGAFVKVYNAEGLVHISELENRRVEQVSDVLREGDKVVVKVLGVDKQGKIRLSRREALNAPETAIENQAQ